MKWFGAAVFAVTSACYPVSNVCDQTLQPLSGPDGGLACVTSTDCPVQGEDGVCSNDGIPAHACVSCEANACVRHVPVLCQ